MEGGCNGGKRVGDTPGRCVCPYLRPIFRVECPAFNSGRLRLPPNLCQGKTMFDKNMRIEGFDDEIFSAIAQEERRQEEHIELIASENYASPRVLQAQGTVLTNKYAE